MRCNHDITYTFDTYLNDGTRHGVTEIEPSCDDGGCSYVVALPAPFEDVEDYEIDWELQTVTIDRDHVCDNGSVPAPDLGKGATGQCAECATAADWERYSYDVTHRSPLHDPDKAREDMLVDLHDR